MRYVNINTNTQKHKQFLQNRKEYKAIYLAINLNIKCFNNVCPSEKKIWYFTSYKDLKRSLDKYYNPKFGIYLGKIIFEKSGNKLIPNYIPTSIENLEEELKNINPLWLAEENPHYVEPKSNVKDFDIPKHATNLDEILKEIPSIRDEYILTSPNNLKFQCKIEKNTKVLTREQIASYVKQIHSKNVKMIQNYMDTIKKNFGIKPYVFDDDFYEELGNLGIIKKEKVECFQKSYCSLKDSVTLNMLDYLAMQNRHNEDYLITFDDELFYAYLVWSLKDFVLELYQGMLQDEIKLLFNPAAYMDDTKINYLNLNREFIKRYEKEISDIGFEKKDSFFVDYFDYYFSYDGIFNFSIFDYFATGEIGLCDYQYSEKIPVKIVGFNCSRRSFESPNLTHSSEKEEYKFTPSILGKYYFRLIYQEKVYIELLHPYYPSSKDLPKDWDNKMLEKANLK